MNYQEMEVKTDLDMLEKLISLPAMPIEAHWYTADIIRSPIDSIGPTDWGLVAKIEFAAQDLNKIIESAEVRTDVSIPSHLPLASIDSSAEKSFQIKQNEKFYYTDLPAYRASSFIKDPLLNGVLYKLSDNILLIYLHTN